MLFPFIGTFFVPSRNLSRYYFKTNEDKSLLQKIHNMSSLRIFSGTVIYYYLKLFLSCVDKKISKRIHISCIIFIDLHSLFHIY